MKGGISRVEVDFQLTTTENSAQTWVFGTDDHENTMRTMCYFTGSGVGSGISFRVRGGENINTPVGDPDIATKTGDRGWSHEADTDRHLLVVDLKNGRDVIVTGTVTNMNLTFSPNLLTNLTADLPLSLFAKYGNKYATSFNKFCRTKIYGARIYENYDMSSDDNSANLVHNFVPCLKDGETPCFKDLVGGGFIIGEDVEAFEASDNAPAYQDDGYLSTVSETAGEYLYADTGYLVKNTTRVELDCALASNMVNNVFWSLFDAYSSARLRFAYNPYLLQWVGTVPGGSAISTDGFPKPEHGKDVRRTFVLNIPGESASVVTSGFTNHTVAVSNIVTYASSGNTLKLACAYSDTWGIASSGLAPLKIYGCKIFESGTLVRDFVPYVKNGVSGLRDGKTGAFIQGKANTSSAAVTVKNLPYGGAVSGEQDAYIESNGGSSGMNTGYKMKGACSRVEVDYQLVDTNSAPSTYVYGCSGSPENTLRTFFYFTGAANKTAPTFRNGDASTQNANSAQWAVLTDADRHIAATDLKNKKCILNPCPSNADSSSLRETEKTFGSDFAGKVADCPLSIFGAFNSYNTVTGAATYKSGVKARIYSVRFYENYVEGGNNTPIRELIPYSRGGVVGFYDTVTGEIVKNDSAAAGAFTFGGVGSDHGALNCYLKPGYATKITHGESQTKTLTAYAPGATSYKWFRDGQLIDDNNDGVADGADGMLPITWARGGTKTDDGYLHTYQAVAVFNLYGVERESESAEVSVTSIYLGTMLLLQ